MQCLYEANGILQHCLTSSVGALPIVHQQGPRPLTSMHSIWHDNTCGLSTKLVKGSSFARHGADHAMKRAWAPLSYGSIPWKPCTLDDTGLDQMPLGYDYLAPKPCLSKLKGLGPRMVLPLLRNDRTHKHVLLSVVLDSLGDHALCLQGSASAKGLLGRDQQSSAVATMKRAGHPG